MAARLLARHAPNALAGEQPHQRRLILRSPARRTGPSQRLRPQTRLLRVETRLPTHPARQDRPTATNSEPPSPVERAGAELSSLQRPLRDKHLTGSEAKQDPVGLRPPRGHAT